MFVYDNKLSREGHDNNDKHKENVKRYIDDVQKRGLQLAEDEAKLKLELERIEAIATGKPLPSGPAVVLDPHYQVKQKEKAIYSPTFGFQTKKLVPDAASTGSNEAAPAKPYNPYVPMGAPTRPPSKAVAGDKEHVYGAWTVVESSSPSAPVAGETPAEPAVKPSIVTIAGDKSGVYGGWTVVATTQDKPVEEEEEEKEVPRPVEPVPGQAQAKTGTKRAAIESAGDDYDDDGGGGGESLRGFKFRQKTLPALSDVPDQEDAASESSSSFKKRSGAKASRSFRSKDSSA